MTAHQPLRPAHRRSSLACNLQLPLWMLAVGAILGPSARAQQPPQLDIRLSASDAVLSWGTPDAVLQTSSAPDGTWVSLSDAVSPHVAPRSGQNAYYRLRLDAPARILSLEPSTLSTSGGTFYLTGMNFSAGTRVFVDGNPAASIVFVNDRLLQVTVGPLAAGTHDVSVAHPDTGFVSSVAPDALTVNATGQPDLESPPALGAPTLATGEVIQRAVDLAIPAGYGPEFVMTRTYRSRLGPANSPLGPGWDFSFNLSVESAGADLVVHDGGGRADRYTLQPGGAWTSPGSFREGDLQGQVFTLTLADTSRWVFRALNDPVAPGKITSITDRNGNALTFAYDPGGRLSGVTDAPGRTCAFTYNGAGRLTQVTDFLGRTVTYAYYGAGEPGGSVGDLKSVTSPAVTGTPNGNDFPAGKTVTYSYTSGFADDRLNHNLAGVTDADGTRVLTLRYSAVAPPDTDITFDRVLSLQLGTNTPAVVTYEAQTPSPANRFALTKVIVNDPVGNVSETLCDSEHRPVSIKALTGRSTPGAPVTSTTNRPAGKLRPADPDAFETALSWNLDSQLAAATLPRGGSVVNVFERDYQPNAPVRERGNLRETSQFAAPGVPSDFAMVTEKIEYQPGFGTDETNSRFLTYVDVEPLSGSTVQGHKRLQYTMKLNRGGFPSKITDPRGNIWTHQFDAHGNLTHSLPPGQANGTSYEYNAQGQVTARIAPPDSQGRVRRDTFAYHAVGPQKGYLQSAVRDANNLALTTSFAYDAAGNCTSVVDPRGNDRQFVYNQLNQVMRVKSAPGAGGARTDSSFYYGFSVLREYKPGILSDFTDQESHYATTRAAGTPIRKDVSNFDSDGNPIGDGTISTGYEYNSIGQLTSVTNEVSDARSIVTRFEYDAAGQLTAALSPLAVSGAEPSNRVQFRYDERGKPFQRTAAPGSADQSTTQFDYDADGNLSRVSAGLEGTPRTTEMEHSGLSFISTQPYHMHFFFDQVFMHHNTGVLASQPVRGGLGVQLGGTGSSNIEVARSSFQLGQLSTEDFINDFMWSGKELSLQHGGTGTKDIESFSVHGFTGGSASLNGGLIYIDSISSSLNIRRGGTGSSILDSHMDNLGLGALSVEDSIYDRMWTGKPLAIENGGTGSSSIETMVGNLGLGVMSVEDRLYDHMWMGSPLSLQHGGTDMVSIEDGYLDYLVKFHNYRTPSGAQDLSTGRDYVGGDDWYGPPLSVENGVTGLAMALFSVQDVSSIGSPQVSYDDHPRSITDPMGNVTEYHYDESGNLTRAVRMGEVVDVPGGAGNVVLAETTYKYDPAGRPIKKTKSLDSGFAEIQLVLEGVDGGLHSPLLRVTDANGNDTTFSHDSAGRLASVTDPRTNTVAFAHDANGNVTTVTTRLKSDLGNPDLVFTRSLAYDKLNRLTNTVDNVGNRSSVAYDSRGLPVRATDARGAVSEAEYDGLGRRTRSGLDLDGDGDALGAGDIVSVTGYDDHSRPVGATDANGNTTVVTYDARNRPVQTVLADGTTHSATYDLLGRVATTTDANGTLVTYTRDAQGRVTGKTVAPGAGVAATTTFEQFSYDGRGLLVRAVNDHSFAGYTYDAGGRRLTETLNGLTVTNTFDLAGNRLTLAYPGGRKLGYTHDDNGLVTSVTLLADATGDTLGVLQTNRYVGGLLERVDRRNGTYTTFSHSGAVGVPNAPGDFGWGQISRLRHLRLADNSVIDDIAYLHDSAQNRIGKAVVFPGRTNLVAYALDAAGRLTNTVEAVNSVLVRNTMYTLDRAGNRLNVTGDAHPGAYTLGNGTPEPADAQVNQYTSTPVGDFTYDLNGNRVGESVGGLPLRAFRYDYKNQLVAVLDGVTGSPIAEYQYDALGRRTAKTTFPPTGPETLSLVYAGGAVIEERDDTGAISSCRTEDVDVAATLGKRWGHWTLERLKVGGTHTNHWTHADADGSELAVTLDDATVAERYEYADFGEPSFLDAAGHLLLHPTTGQPFTQSAVGNTWLWMGMEFQPETGFHALPNGAGGAPGGTMADPRVGEPLFTPLNWPPPCFQPYFD